MLFKSDKESEILMKLHNSRFNYREIIEAVRNYALVISTHVTLTIFSNIDPKNLLSAF